ncbi:GNAT family N-acetyltransferase [Phytohabitans houttuyneae]|uniref:GCN5 family N-acetyltransferase n=1 Tax=Phytohabitans houttuyneae TaxID=1076126 RepID=A0A6V8KJ79_9ACTN|nr:GNAT family N-acetyltransferase [Phytohabitans houttuyneae]GFJ82036.1 GCN5 family N-acetyltransferase [Phytohabitans houttuyneae]
MLSIKPAKASDSGAIADLLEEMDRFYGSTEFDPIEKRISAITAMLFGESSVAHALLCHDGGELVGLASYSFLWPAKGLTCSLFLKELYVRQDRRGQGVGKLLMQEIGRIAIAKECSRVEWMTELDNRDAQGFYAAFYASPRSGKVFYRLEDKEIHRLTGDTPTSSSHDEAG